MAPPNLRPFFKNFITVLFLLLLHLGCFVFSSGAPRRRPSTKRKFLSLSSSLSFLKRIITRKQKPDYPNPVSPFPSVHSSVVAVNPPESLGSDHNGPHASCTESDISSGQIFFPLRNDIYPCPACGEIFQKPNLLEQHRSVKHAVSELTDGESGKNIVQIIFGTGWPDKAKSPNIHRILKIHNSQKTLARFEEYRESVKSRAVRRHDERCAADGNELLRFYCATFLCDLGQNGNSSICNHQYCSVCGIIGSGFSPKMDGLSVVSTGWRAHVAIPEDIEEEFGFLHVKRAVLICRVIAGRIGSESDPVDKSEPGFDSVVGRGMGTPVRLDEEDELLVFNARAVLPCFVIVYSV